MTHNVARRRREIGIRLALGTSRSSIVQLVVKEGLRLTVIGLVVGTAGSLASNRRLSPLLFQVDPFDPRITVAVMGGLTSISLLASLLPARRAASISPVRILRLDC